MLEVSVRQELVSPNELEHEDEVSTMFLGSEPEKGRDCVSKGDLGSHNDPRTSMCQVVVVELKILNSRRDKSASGWWTRERWAETLVNISGTGKFIRGIGNLGVALWTRQVYLYTKRQ